MRCHTHTGGSVNRLLVVSDEQATSKCGIKMRKKGEREREGEGGRKRKKRMRRVYIDVKCTGNVITVVLVLQA